MNKFIHISQDEKFINSGFAQFENIFPNQNQLIVYDCPSKELKHISIEHEKIFFLENIEDIAKKICRGSVIVFHSLPNHLLKILNSIDKQIPVIWLLFGFETYEDYRFYNSNTLLDKLTYLNFGKKDVNNSKVEKLKEIIYPIVRLIFKDWRFSKNEIINLQKLNKINMLKRIDYFGFAYLEEYKLQCHLLNFNRPFFNFLYYPIEKIVTVDQEVNLIKNKILIGHSGFSNGNHLDIINKIKDYDIGNSILNIPFSYGDKNYINKVKPLLIKVRDDLNFIEEFIPLESYNNILQTVKIAIFNNRRQQALGNIIALLYMGSKIFLSEKNTFYHFLKRNRIIIYSYEKELNEKSIKNGLTFEEITENKNIIYSLYNSNKLNEELKESINIILKNDQPTSIFNTSS